MAERSGMGRAPVACTFLLGLLVGAGGVVLWGRPAPAGPSGPSGSTESTEPRQSVAPESGSQPVAGAVPRVEPAARQADTPSSAGPGEPGARELVATGADPESFAQQARVFATAEVRRGWAELRADAVPPDVLAATVDDAVETMLALAAGLGRQAAERRNREERATTAFAAGDGFELVHALAEDGAQAEHAAQAAEFVRSKGFATLFQSRGGGSTLDGATYRSGSALQSGTVLAFPAGVFELVDLSNGNEPFPSDITVRGTGMDTTLIYLASQDARSGLQRFSIEDCTIYCAGGITDVRSAPVVMSLRRVRVIGFDCGAGGSVAIRIGEGVALHATDCRFEAGYGRNPAGLANLARISGPCLARFERCMFDRLDLAGVRDTSVEFVDCAMNDLLGAVPTGPVYTNCRVTICDQDKKWDEAFRRRDLNALFPHLGGNLQRR